MINNVFDEVTGKAVGAVAAGMGGGFIALVANGRGHNARLGHRGVFATEADAAEAVLYFAGVGDNLPAAIG